MSAQFTTVSAVKASLGLAPYDVQDDDWLEACVNAVNVYVADLRLDLAYDWCSHSWRFGPFDAKAYSGTFDVARVQAMTEAECRNPQHATNARVALGATMLAARWYRRRNSDSDASFTEFGGSPTPPIDRDVETLLGIGRAFRPVVG